jgi:hypothetical protein
MKHLTTYKIFESKSETIKNDLQDICLELTDIGLEVEIARYIKMAFPKYWWQLTIRYDKPGETYIQIKKFNLNDIKEILIRICDYLRYDATYIGLWMQPASLNKPDYININNEKNDIIQQIENLPNNEFTYISVNYKIEE